MVHGAIGRSLQNVKVVVELPPCLDLAHAREEKWDNLIVTAIFLSLSNVTPGYHVDCLPSEYAERLQIRCLLSNGYKSNVSYRKYCKCNKYSVLPVYEVLKCIDVHDFDFFRTIQAMYLFCNNITLL